MLYVVYEALTIVCVEPVYWIQLSFKGQATKDMQIPKVGGAIHASASSPLQRRIKR